MIGLLQDQHRARRAASETQIARARGALHNAQARIALSRTRLTELRTALVQQGEPTSAPPDAAQHRATPT